MRTTIATHTFAATNTVVTNATNTAASKQYSGLLLYIMHLPPSVDVEHLCRNMHTSQDALGTLWPGAIPGSGTERTGRTGYTGSHGVHRS